MINSTFQVTFGIEIECVLAFHETLLRNHLADTNTDSKIIKDIPDDVRRKLNQVPQDYVDEDAGRHDTSRQKYMGWGLTAPTAYPADLDHRFQEHMDAHRAEHGYRAYGGEVLRVAQTLLPDGVAVHDAFNGTDKHDDFSHWHLTQQRSSAGVDKQELTRRLDRLAQATPAGAVTAPLKRPNMSEDWDTHPLELVSRVLPYDPASMAEVHQHLTALQAGPAHFAFPTKHCGFHVHVGLPVPSNHPAGTPPPTFALPTLQHLAYIQVKYQSAISALHPPARGDGTNSDLATNLDNFHAEPDLLTDAQYAALDARLDAGEDPAVVYADRPPTFSLQRARAQIFATDMTIPQLSALMGGTKRGRIVNWTYIARTNGEARTLEFRQHAGTLNPPAVAHWTAFVVGLVRLADHNARAYGSGADYDGAGYADEGAGVWGLMEGMGLGEGEVGYWRGVVGGRGGGE